jgi:SHS2 domain-containing protein
MSFELRDHTADVAVSATADDLDGVYAALADGLAAAMCDEIPAEGDRFSLSRRAESREALLFDYLDRLLYERDVRGVLPVENEARVTDRGPDAGDERWVVKASARGVPLSAVDAREVKAVTYSEMDLSETDEGWRAYVVFDV